MKKKKKPDFFRSRYDALFQDQVDISELARDILTERPMDSMEFKTAALILSCATNSLDILRKAELGEVSIIPPAMTRSE